MKNTLFKLGMVALCLPAIAACGNSGGGGGKTPQNPIDLGPTFNAKYYPKASDNQVASLVKNISGDATIHVALNYEGTEPGWNALASEYSRLCGEAVSVEIKTFGSTADYVTNLQIQENNPRSTWDIISGNLLNKSDSSCVSLISLENTKNPYMGNEKWKDALEEKVYKGDSNYMLNTEDLLTAWFVNKNAATDAGASAEEMAPKTWEGLIALLTKLQTKGYKYPLGLSLTSDSIKGSQFAWLLRIYGDYFTRNNYKYISKSFNSDTGVDPLFTYDPTNQEIESLSTCDRSYSRMLCTMLDVGCDYYIGPKSGIYEQFVGMIAQLKPFIHPSSATFTFNDIRTQFQAQSLGDEGKESPQIVLDYSGKGLQFKAAEKLKNNVGMFDYPYMSFEDVPSNTILRDVGGNGGYLSIFSCQTAAKQALDKDFLKFVVSPYGQSIYYKALSENSVAPQGITTVKNDLVVIPEAWKEFFQSKEVTNTGKADKNKYLTYGILGLEKIDYDKTDKDTKNATNLWKQLLTGKDYSVTDYCNDWSSILSSAWSSLYATKSGWPEDAYKNSHFNDPNYIKDSMK